MKLNAETILKNAVIEVIKAEVGSRIIVASLQNAITYLSTGVIYGARGVADLWCAL